MEEKITTIKLGESTKERLDALKEYKRESYDEILKKMLEILNICRANPDRARSRLIGIEKKKRESRPKAREKSSAINNRILNNRPQF